MAGLKEFIEKFDSDTELQKKVEAVKDENELLQMITDAGYDVKPEELRDILTKAASEGELSENDLENVAGGSSCWDKFIKKITTVITGTPVVGLVAAATGENEGGLHIKVSKGKH